MPYFVRPAIAQGAPDALGAVCDELLQRPFVPHRSLRNKHLQTLLSQRPRSVPFALERRTLNFDSGMVLEADVLAPASPTGPTLICIHGMGGDPESGYMRGFARRAYARGWGAYLLNLYDLRAPGTGRPTVFHAGNSAALKDVVTKVLSETKGWVFLAGVSLGGNMTLKLLGEWGAQAPSCVGGAALLSPLLDLPASWPILERRTRRPYRHHFLRSLFALVEEHRARIEEFVDVERIFLAKTIRQFDSALTAPLAGFSDVFAYYGAASAAPLMAKIEVPTLVLFSADDPVLPLAPLMTTQVRQNPNILAALTLHGGHVGFVERGPSDDRSWAEDRAMTLFENVASSSL